MTRESNANVNIRRRSRPIMPGIAAAAAAILLAACGSAGASSGSGGTAAPRHQAVTPNGPVIATAMLPGIGTVLVTPAGKTVYSPQQEGHGKILCVGACLSFWFPISVAPGASLHAPSGLPGVLSSIRRSDGLTQLTYDGKPLYTFRLDRASGQANGNGFTDHFGGLTFNWHALTTAGTPAGAGSSSSSYPSGSSGY
jgi:predicted lipoprotein with Yx(FWY)xxD motif